MVNKKSKVRESQNMHFAHVIPTFAESYGGTTLAAFHLGVAQARIGEEVSFWGTGDNEMRRKFSALDINTFLFNSHWPHRWFRSPALVRGLADRIRLIDLLEVHGIWEYTSFAATKVAHKANTPYVVFPAGVFLHPWRYRTTKKQIYLHLLGNRMLGGASCLHVASEMEAKGCLEAGFRVPIAVVPNGIDLDLYSTLPDPSEAEKRWPVLKDRLVLLFLSRISPEKGFDQCLPAIKDLVDTGGYKDLLFVIAGPDDRGHQAVVEGLVERNGLKPYVFFTGMVQGEEKLALYRRADSFVLPSYSENFGIVITEALACGIPVVTTTGTPWKELVDADAGRWVAPERGALAEALRDLLGMSEEKRREMGQRGRKLVFENYTWDIAARKMITVYRCILEGKEIPLYPYPSEA